MATKKRVDRQITVTVDVDDIETVLGFAQVNMDAINEKEFKHIQKSVSAVSEAVIIGRRVAWDEHNAKERTP